MATEKPQHHIVNCETGETTIVDFTDEEIAHFAAMALEEDAFRASREAEELARAEAKASALAKLTALGLTTEEANALAGN
jgi:hypothetical protein